MPFLVLLFLFFGNYNLSAQYNLSLDDLMRYSYKELDSLVMIPYQKAQYNRCLIYAKAAREKAKRELGIQSDKYAEYCQAMSFFLEHSGDYYHALSALQEATKIYAKKPKESPYAGAIVGQANLYQLIGDYERAEALFIEANQIYAATFSTKHSNYATSLNNLAFLYQHVGRYEQAEALFLEANQIYADTLGKAHFFYGKSLNSLALLYQSMGKIKAAEALLLEANEIIGNALGKTHYQYAYSTVNLAILYLNEKRYDKAETLLLKAKDVVYKSLGDQHLRYAETINHLAKLYTKTERYAKALPLLEHCHKIYQALYGDNHPHSISFNSNLAFLYYQLGSDAQAWTYLNQSFVQTCKTTAALPENTTIFSNILHQNYSYLQHNNLIKALEVAFLLFDNQVNVAAKQQIISIVLELLKRNQDNFATNQDKLRMLNKSHHWLLKRLALTDKMDKVQAFEWADQHKAVLLLQASNNEKNYQLGALPENLVQEERQLFQQKDHLHASLAEIRPEKALDSLRQQLNQVHQKIQQLKETIEENHPKYAQFKYASKNSSVEELQNHLDSETALLEYVLGDSSIHIFYVDKTSIQWVEHPITLELIKGKIQALHQALSNYQLLTKRPQFAYQEYTTLAYWFYKNLITPVLPNNKNIQHLIVIPDGELGYLPFEAFLTEAMDLDHPIGYNELPYLCKSYQISYNYSATLWQQNKTQEQRNSNHQILAMAADYNIQLDSSRQHLRLPTYQQMRERLEALPAAQAEVKALEKAFDGVFAYGKDASERRMKEKASTFAIIHLAMHGFLDNQRPLLSSLAFTEDGDSLENNFWQAHEISKMNLQANLVVLSACETGYGKFEQGNGIASLARAFMYAGASSLIVSLWQVNDQVTANIMQNLYHNLANGMPKDQALGAAKIQYLNKAQGNLAHPAFWSPFVLIGNNDAIYISRKGNFQWHWWLLGGLFLIGCGVLFFKKRKETL